MVRSFTIGEILIFCSFFFPAILGIFVFPYLMLHESGIQPLVWPEIFGHKSRALFDLWSFQHFLFGVMIGAMCWESDTKLRGSLAFAFCLSVFWEGQEVYGRMGWGIFDLPPIGAVTRWFGGVEHLGNRMLDPILVTTGTALGWEMMCRGWEKAYAYVSRFTGIFFLTHICMPNTMWLQTLLFD